MKRYYWKTWYGAPVALIMSIFGFLCHPLTSIGEYSFYSRMDRDSEYPIGRWTHIVRACTDIDMS